jgi:hypothetical protein
MTTPEEPQLSFWSEEPPASRSPSPASEKEWQNRVATWPSSFSALLMSLGPDGLSGKMCLESCHLTQDGILAPSSLRWGNSGMGGPIECWTLNTSEFHSAGGVSLLSGVLETGEVPQRFFLSARACLGILRRAKKRGKALPTALEDALIAVIGQTQTTLSPQP